MKSLRFQSEFRMMHPKLWRACLHHLDCHFGVLRMKKKKGGKRPEQGPVNDRREELVWRIVEAGGTIEFKEVQDLYDGKKGKFNSDGRRLKEIFEELTPYFDPLGYAVPTVNCNGNSISIPIRKFAQLLHPNALNPKRSLARAVIDAKYNHTHLIPREGNLFLGIGSTMCQLVSEIIDRRKQFTDQFHIFTQNFELATYFNFAAPKKDKPESHFSLQFPGQRLDFDHGCLVEEKPASHIDTAILGIHNITSDGQMFITPIAWETTQHFLELVHDRIIILADGSKKERAGNKQYEITLPKASHYKKALFVTDENYKDGPIPKGFEHISLKCT